MTSTLKTGSHNRSKLTTLTEDHKRWCVFGIALNHVVVPAIRPVLEQEILNEYNDLKLKNNIHVQTTHSFPSPKYPTCNAMKYENINGNDTKLKAPHYKKFDYSKFDYKVTSHVDFAMIFLLNYMAKLNAFDETCDASAVLTLLGRIPVFSAALQNAANVVRECRNAWGHCNFTKWNESKFKKSFDDMEKLLREVGLSPADESKVLADLNDWKDKGVALCMNASIDSELVKVMQEHVIKLSSDVNKMAFESQEELCNLKEILENTHENLQNCEKRVKNMELTQDTMQHELSSTNDEVEQLKTNQEVIQKEHSSISARVDLHQAGHEAIQQRVTKIEGRQNISYGFSDCTSDIEYFAGRYDPDTRLWLLQDFNKWFSDSGNSRAYVLLGDAAVGKSVMAAVVAQRAKKDGNMAAAYFCRHYDGTRRDPSSSEKKMGYIMNVNYMAKLSAFDETCDASAVLILLGKVPVFSISLKNAAIAVRESRNAWGHCDVTKWDESNFKKGFDDMEKLLREFGFSPADELKVLADLNDWKDKGVALCMNASIDSELVKVMQEHVTKLSSDVNKMAFESQEELCNLKEILENTHENLQNCEKRVKNMELTQDTMKQELSYTAANVSQLKTEQEVLQQELSSTIDKVDQLTIDQEVLQEEQSFISARVEMHQVRHEAIQQRVTKLEGRQNISYVFSDCTSDIEYFAGRYDPDTRHWFLEDFNKWFSDSGNSRAYVLLGDAAVGKSVMAAVVAQRAKKDGNMAAAYFCRHYDGTRRDPRYLLGSIAYQLCNCNSQYDRVVGGEFGVQNMLTNDKLGVHELFTKLLEEPLSKCGRIAKKIVVIDALDEAEYWSREDFLDLIMNRFPMLPKWLVFFITSRPEDSVQFRLKTYNPCIRICAGNSDSAGFYQQHKQDIQRFFEKNVKFTGLSYSAEELTEKCNGMFLYAFYLVEILKNTTQLSSNLFPGNINDFFYKNFKRVHKKVGENVYRKLFGCAFVAPSPLPVSFISFLLERENSALDKQEVIDAVSHFVALRTSDKTFAFLHSLIPAWLVNEQKASRMLFIDRRKGSKLFKNIVIEFLSDFTQERWDNLSYYEPDLVNYISCFGFRFLISEESRSSEIVFNALTNYRFLEQRIRSNRIGIYSLIEDLEISLGRLTFGQREKKNLEDICFVLKRDKYNVTGCPELLYSCLRNDPELTRADFKTGPGSCWMESGIRISSNAKTVLNSMDCFAFSHDKTLFAGGKQRCLYLYNARSFDSTLGPFEVMNESISHLTFFPDDKFVFFGRLDRWFSVQEKRVVEMSQFSGNSRHYRWGSFVHDGKYIALTSLTSLYKRRWCYLYMFLRWAEHERDFVVAMSQTQDNYFNVIKRELFREHERHCTGLCAVFEKIKTSVRDQIVVLYADLFQYQIWNVQTGRPVVEEMFSLQLEPFFYIWHFNSRLEYFEDMIEYATPERHSKLTIPKYAALDKFGHCTVSSDNKMLACCIANDILIFPLNGQDTFCKVPQNHSGKIEYCEFLRGNRYLISYGIDGVVFLFDLLEWKSVAYRRQESIVRIAISPDEDKLACLYSSGDVSIIRLYGLKTGLPQNFQLPSIPRHLQRDSEVQDRQVVRPPDQTHSENENLMDVDELMWFIYQSESSDDDESDETDLLSDERSFFSNLE
ncbi:LOW QUALITY PROTEIN: uncharacterized protein LOC114537853 [Dendronephthya gigantea]|uniref:LOW QUALITY PROTEIN: uncharacterized protein LOC114537853 n=1 Tax=Dendronephthya gigantea TaxID=151771 RepID=UPI0010695543|nr:LOW QUALITY PROTEIN: uncharacterized protein LOC114537853 [Dendronephthya gigantea]